MTWVEPHKYGLGPFSGTGVGAGGGVTVTHAAVAGQKHCVTAIECSGDAAALVTIESPSGTVLYRKRFAGAFVLSEGFPTPLVGADSSAVLVKVSASTTNSEANIQGYSEPSA